MTRFASFMLLCSLAAALPVAQGCAGGPTPATVTAPAEDPTVRRLETDLERHPDDGVLLYVLARHRARTGHAEEALALLERLRDTGWDYALEHHDFEAVADNPRFRAVAATLAAREPAVGEATLAFAVDHSGLLSEGMTRDPATGRFFLGAAELRRVLVVDDSGTVTGRWPPDGSGAETLLAPLGMDVDPRAGRLWVATATMPFMPDYDPSLDGRSLLVALDLTTGEVVESFPLGSTDDPVVLNDLAVLPDGRVAVTDSQNDRVLMADPATGRLEPLTPPGAPLWAPNGIALPPNEPDHLVVATLRGLARVDLDGRVIPLPNPPGVHLGGIDGLEPAGDHLIGIQNLPGRPRVWALSRPEDDGPIRADLLSSKDDRLGNPTTGAYAADRGIFFYMANPFGGNEPVRMLALPFDP